MYKEKYAVPEMELIEFETEDVITASGGSLWDDDEENVTPLVPFS